MDSRNGPRPGDAGLRAEIEALQVGIGLRVAVWPAQGWLKLLCPLVSATGEIGGGGSSQANFTAETLQFGSNGGLQNAPMNGKWFAAWTNSQAANGAAITSAL